MTTSHTLTLFSIVLARLEPYTKRTKPDCILQINYEYSSAYGAAVRISASKWRNATILDHKFFSYNFNSASMPSINDFIDDVIEATKPFYN